MSDLTEDDILDQMDKKLEGLKGTPPAEPADNEGGEEVLAEDTSPPGFKTYEQYVADGGDPDLYKGKKAYEAEHSRIEDNKRLRSEIKELKELSRTVASTMSEWQAQQAKTIRAQLEAELKEAKEIGDVDAALSSQKKIDALGTDKPIAKPQINPVIKEFMEKNPILDASSDQYNKDFFDDVVKYHNKEVAELTIYPLGDPRSGTDLTDAQVAKCARRAYERAKDLNADLFKSPRNERPGQTRQQAGAAKGASLRTKLASLNIATRNQALNGDAAVDMYDMLHAKDPKAAERYAKNILGE